MRRISIMFDLGGMHVTVDNGVGSPMAWTIGSVVAYLGLYTAYDKSSKKLEAKGVLDVVLCRKGLDFTAVQMNKVISLAGLSGLGLAFMPGFDGYCSDPQGLFRISAGLMGAHIAYSSWKYYGSGNIPYVSSFPSMISEARSSKSKDVLNFKRKLSILCGISSSSLMFACWPMGYIPVTVGSSCSILGLGVLHFYLMEVDYKNALQVRPFGMTAFVIPILALVASAARFMQK
mmetsp:Transcript_3673/g.5346  ORF Transcript_3673/g.5346 Transcript_3673/m.5346 type:complete len:232 (+) Transcript_3673:114-809(+)